MEDELMTQEEQEAWIEEFRAELLLILSEIGRTSKEEREQEAEMIVNSMLKRWNWHLPKSPQTPREAAELELM